MIHAHLHVNTKYIQIKKLLIIHTRFVLYINKLPLPTWTVRANKPDFCTIAY